MRIKSAIAMFSLAILPFTTCAEVLTYEFTATIGSMFEHDAQTKINTNVSTSLLPGSNFSIGEFIVGKFSYDLAAVPSSSDSSGTVGNLVFGAAVKSFSFLIPATGFKYESEMGTGGDAVFSDSAMNPFGWDNFSPFSNAAYNTSIFQSANINLFDRTGTAFTGYSLPSSLSLSSFHYSNLHFAWLRKADGDQFHFNGPLQSLSLVTAVPVPGVLALFSSGLALVLTPSLRRRSLFIAPTLSK